MDTASIRRVAKEMRERKVNHGKHTSPTLIAWADQLEVAVADSLEQPAASPSAVHTALRTLIAAGFVTQAKANEALRIATGFMSGPLEAPMSPAIAPPFKVARDKLDFSYGDVYVSRPYYRDATIEERKAITQMPVPPAPTSAEPVSIAALLNHEQLSAFASSCGYSNEEAFFTLELLDAAIAGAPQPANAEPVASPCTCPSGDGSLRWPCPQHPPTESMGRDVMLPAWIGELLVNIKRSCIRGRNAAGVPETSLSSAFVATCDHVESMADQALGGAHAPPASCNPATQPASVPDGLEALAKEMMEISDKAGRAGETDISDTWRSASTRVSRFARTVALPTTPETRT